MSSFSSLPSSESQSSGAITSLLNIFTVMVSFVLFSENSQGDQSVKDLNTAPDEDKS